MVLVWVGEMINIYIIIKCYIYTYTFTKSIYTPKKYVIIC